MTEDDAALFAGYEPVPAPEPEKLSADRRRTIRQAQSILAGIHPLTKRQLHPLASRHRDSASPKSDPFTCGSCVFREVIQHHNRSFAKCLFGITNEGGSARLSHSAATDVRAWWPACGDYSPGEKSLSPDAARCFPDGADA